MLDWKTEEDYWRNNYSTRPYIGANRDFDYWRPGYQYGYESATRYPGKTWNDVEVDLRTGWDRFEHRSCGATPGAAPQTKLSCRWY